MSTAKTLGNSMEARGVGSNGEQSGEASPMQRAVPREKRPLWNEHVASRSQTSKTPGFSVPLRTHLDTSLPAEQVQPRLLPLLSYITSPSTPHFHPWSQRREPGKRGTYWGTMVIWTKQMKRKTSEAHAT